MPLNMKVQSLEGYLQMVTTRMPFRYGAARLVRCPHLYMVATIRDAHGRSARGIAADHLPPKWFDKDPAKSFVQEVSDQLRVISWATDAALAAPATSPFRFWFEVYSATQTQAHRAGLPPLLGGFGPSLVERAVNDAAGHLLAQPFHTLLAGDALGIDLGLIDSGLRDINTGSLLPGQPLTTVAARHTVGLADPIRTKDFAPGERLEDGLPQSLEEVVSFYGVRYFKLKISNNLQDDLERLTSIAGVLDNLLPDTAYHCTLDGNEQYATVDQLLPLLEALRDNTRLRRLAASILFIEQPLARAVALDPERCAGIERITGQFPLIIDESDDSLDAYPRALALGYNGTSHKNCKNAFKSIANLARSRQRTAQMRLPTIMSAEDLSNIGVVALQQDLTALSALGITHAERNGHHYFRGLSHLDRPTQARALAAHPGLYTQGDDYVRLNITDGQIDCGTLHRTPGLGVGAWPDLTTMLRIEDFDPATAAAE